MVPVDATPPIDGGIEVASTWVWADSTTEYGGIDEDGGGTAAVGVALRGNGFVYGAETYAPNRGVVACRRSP